jgi:hypothetical protein
MTYTYNNFHNKLAFIILIVCLLKADVVNKAYLKYSECLNLKTKHPEKVSDKNIDYVPIILFSLPILYLMYADFSMEGDNWEVKFFNTNVYSIISERFYEYILRIAGAYGLIQVLAQDIGLKTGLNQRNFAQNPIAQFFILYGGAYSFTGFKGEAMLSTFLYLMLKYNASLNITSDVCFESV